jgi:hypothetical protein
LEMGRGMRKERRMYVCMFIPWVVLYVYLFFSFVYLSFICLVFYLITLFTIHFFY